VYLYLRCSSDSFFSPRAVRKSYPLKLGPFTTKDEAVLLDVGKVIEVGERIEGVVALAVKELCRNDALS